MANCYHSGLFIIQACRDRKLKKLCDYLFKLSVLFQKTMFFYFIYHKVVLESVIKVHTFKKDL
jgi:hypothetical protein